LASILPEFLQQHLNQENFILKIDCQDPRLAQFLALLSESPSEKIEKLAKNSGLSSRTLARLIAQELATTPKAIQQKIRLEQAIELLRSGESVTNVAYEIGYQSLGAFIDAFKHHTGKLPSDFLA
jgi:AraC-like DNA-binding protein